MNGDRTRLEDKQKKVKEITKNQRVARGKINVKINVVKSVFLLLIFFLIIKITYIKVVNGEEFEKRAVIQQSTRRGQNVLKASRGDILDRNGTKLATSQIVYKVILDIRVVDEISSEKKENTLNGLTETMGIPRTELDAYFVHDPVSGKLLPENDTNYKILANEISYEEGKTLKDKKLTGVFLEESGKRFYPFGTTLAQVIGFTRGDDPNEYYGLENYYNSYLTGKDGRYFLAYDETNTIANNEIKPTNGNTLNTTVDLQLQQYAEEIVRTYGEKYTANNASLILMDPNTGEVLAMAQYPSFDLNAPTDVSRTNSSKYLRAYEEADDEKKGSLTFGLWKNYNISSTYEPGSIFKPAVIAAALQENAIKLTDTFYCGGSKTFSDGTVVNCWYRQGHGSQTLGEALAHSCNVALMDIGQKLTARYFYKYQKDFGFGSTTGIDLPSEVNASNLIYKEEQLNSVELATSSMGQGFNSTALQNIVAFSALINGGNIVKPYIVSQITDEEQNVVYKHSTEVVREVLASEISDDMKKMLPLVVSEIGTGKKAIIEGYEIGGKTGTGEQGVRGSDKYALSFVGYLLSEGPDVIAISVLDLPPNVYEDGVTSATPMVHEMFLKVIDYYNIQPSKEMENGGKNNNSVTLMEDYTGRNVKDVVDELNAAGINFDTVGSGDIIESHIPNAGQVINSKTTIRLYITNDEKDELVSIPDVVGKTSVEAKTVLEDLGFNVIISTGVNSFSEEDDGVAETTDDVDTVGNEDVVYRQTPTSGSKLSKGITVKVFVSK